jgi:hypothetical protein
VRWSEGLSNRVTVIIRRYIDQYEVCCLYGCLVYHILADFFGSFFIIVYMFCMLLFNIVNYVFLLLHMFRSGCSVSLCCSVYCLYVNVYCTTATGCQPNCS